MRFLQNYNKMVVKSKIFGFTLGLAQAGLGSLSRLLFHRQNS
jgi:hypothetical protein